MLKKSITLLLLMGFNASLLYSQNNTSSPYTRYGYGNLVDAGFGQSKAMGGLSFGLRSNQFVNPGNPASYTAIDSMTFRFEAGVAAKISTFSDDEANQSKFDANLEYLAMQFPIKRWLGMSAGLLPYSFVGYDFYSKTTQPSTIINNSLTSTYTYTGNGGISQVYIGLGVTPIRNLSIGANVGYNFGKIEHESTVTFDSSTYRSMNQSKQIDVSDFVWMLGAQYEKPLENQKKLTFGVTFQPKSKLSADAQQVISSAGVDTVTIDNSNDFETPLTFGLGFVYNFSDRLMAGLDYKRQNWSDVKYFGKKTLTDRNKIAAGVEFLPKSSSKKYLERVSYRLGANFSNSYVKVNDETVNEYSITAGFGLPLKRGLNPTIMNLVFEYGNIGTTTDNLIQERYFKFTLNATINEKWFMKRKFE
jgi:hypothetical protein